MVLQLYAYQKKMSWLHVASFYAKSRFYYQVTLKYKSKIFRTWRFYFVQLVSWCLIRFYCKTRVLFGQIKCIWYFNNKIKSYQILNFVLLPSYWKAFKIIFFKGILFPKFKLYFKCSRFCSHSCLNTNIFCKNLRRRKTLALFTLCCNTAVDRH